jgi:hypothetical protein
VGAEAVIQYAGCVTFSSSGRFLSVGGDMGERERQAPFHHESEEVQAATVKLAQFIYGDTMRDAEERIRRLLGESVVRVDLEEGFTTIAEATASFYGLELATSEAGVLSALIHRGAERMRAEGRLDVRDRMEAVASLNRLIAAAHLEGVSLEATLRLGGLFAWPFWPFTQ